LINTKFAEANDVRSTPVASAFCADKPAYNFCADDKPVVVSALHLKDHHYAAWTGPMKWEAVFGACND
jgi:hypothetical protein